MIHLHRDMERLKKGLLTIGGLVEQAIEKSVRALVDRHADLAREVIDGDARIDRLEVELEEEALKALALHQPVAVDLRFVAAVIKVNNDLERISDDAANLGERAAFLAGREPIPIPERMSTMTEMAMQMVHDALDAFVNQDAEAARRIIARDDEVDDCNVAVIAELHEMMQSDPDAVERALHLFSASRYLERIADLATNIAEDVVYIVEGEIVRHQHGGG